MADYGNIHNRFKGIVINEDYSNSEGDLVFSEKVKTNKTQFLNKVRSVSNKLGIDPNWLMAVMNSESSLNEKARNPSGATGLIQFMPKTAIGLGTTTDAIYRMSNVEQLDYVYKYLSKFVGKMKSYIDVYTAVFFPIAIGKPDNFILQTDTLSKELIARQNPIFDLDRNSTITVGELKKAFLKRIPTSFQDYFQKGLQTIKSHPVITALVTATILFSAYFLIFGKTKKA